MVVEFIVPPLVSGQFPVAAVFNDATANNRIRLSITGATGQFSFFVASGGVTQANIGGATLTEGAIARVAVSWNTDSFRLAVNGTGATEDTSGTVPTGLTQLELGSQLSGGSPFNSHLSKVLYLPRQLSQAALNSWSTL